MLMLSSLSVEELVKLSKDIRSELDNRLKETKEAIAEVNKNSNMYEFYFKSESSFKNKPYVARCEYSSKYGISRIFKHLEETAEKGYVVVEGKYNAKDNEILDVRYRNSDYGISGYYIAIDGDLKFICKSEDNHKISSIKQLLKGDLPIQTFLELTGVISFEIGVIDELKD